MKIRHLYISPGHNFFGHHGQPAGEHSIVECPTVECVAGQGIRGDRFFNFKEDYKGQITFFSWEVYEELCERLQVHDKSPGALRRNVVLAGIDLNTLLNEEFIVQGVRFQGAGECAPCHWMNQAFHPEAEEALQGRGGLRARILSDGILSRDVTIGT